MKPTIEQRRIIEAVVDSCEYVISLIKPGRTVKELCQAGDEFLLGRGVSLSSEQNNENQIYAAFPPHWGHSLGMTLERPWFINEEDVTLKENMYLAIEKGLYQPGMGTATYEQNLIVTKTGAEVLTTTKTLWI